MSRWDFCLHCTAKVFLLLAVRVFKWWRRGNAPNHELGTGKLWHSAGPTTMLCGSQVTTCWCLSLCLLISSSPLSGLKILASPLPLVPETSHNAVALCLLYGSFSGGFSLSMFMSSQCSFLWKTTVPTIVCVTNISPLPERAVSWRN